MKFANHTLKCFLEILSWMRGCQFSPSSGLTEAGMNIIKNNFFTLCFMVLPDIPDVNLFEGVP